MKNIIARAPFLAPLLFVAACNTTTADVSGTSAIGRGGVETGRQIQRGPASWYQMGRRTANGEVFNPNGMTAAHRTLPFGTRVRVVHEGNGRSVVVRINDRGPFTRGRVIDLARGPAQYLGLMASGVALVSLHRVE
jgi:rare lipoprotein A